MGKVTGESDGVQGYQVGSAYSEDECHRDTTRVYQKTLEDPGGESGLGGGGDVLGKQGGTQPFPYPNTLCYSNHLPCLAAPEGQPAARRLSFL
jgi:hypothetical protein